MHKLLHSEPYKAYVSPFASVTLKNTRERRWFMVRRGLLDIILTIAWTIALSLEEGRLFRIELTL